MKWISVEDRTPGEELEEEFLLTWDGSCCLVELFWCGEFTNALMPYKRQEEVTHWMPLPQPPEEKDSAEYLMCRMTQEEFEKWRSTIAPSTITYNTINSPPKKE